MFVPSCSQLKVFRVCSSPGEGEGVINRNWGTHRADGCLPGLAGLCASGSLGPDRRFLPWLRGAASPRQARAPQPA